jgi:HAD superfamily hydrolase (TIGR01509 family)
MKLELPEGSFKAYLFDCDGTIVDSMPVHYRAWKQALGEWNCVFEEELFYKWGGRPMPDIISTLNRDQGLQMPIDAVSRRREELYFEMMSQVKAIPEVQALVEAEYGRIPFAIVSGSTREAVTASLAALNLLDRFETIICADDYAKGKPDPEGFLLAAERLGVAPKECLVFEDTDMGIQAATAAGMASVRIPSYLQRKAS